MNLSLLFASSSIAISLSSKPCEMEVYAHKNECGYMLPVDAHWVHLLYSCVWNYVKRCEYLLLPGTNSRWKILRLQIPQILHGRKSLHEGQRTPSETSFYLNFLQNDKNFFERRRLGKFFLFVYSTWRKLKVGKIINIYGMFANIPGLYVHFISIATTIWTSRIMYHKLKASWEWSCCLFCRTNA